MSDQVAFPVVMSIGARAFRGCTSLVAILTFYLCAIKKVPPEKQWKKWITHGSRLRDPYCMGQRALHLFKIRHCASAIYYMVQAAEAGHILSMFRLAKMFCDGYLWIKIGNILTCGGFTTDEPQGRHWLCRLVEKLTDCGFDILGAWDPQQQVLACNASRL